MKSLVTPALSLLLSGVGVLMSYAWYNGAGWVLVIVGALAILAFAAMTARAWQLLPHDPVRAVSAFEHRLFAVAAITAVVSGIVIILGIELVVPDPADDAPDAEYQKAMKTIAASGLAAIIAFISTFGTKAEGFQTAVGDAVRGAFAKRYEAVDDKEQPRRLENGAIALPRGSTGWESAFGEFAFDGWDSSERRKRAARLASYLRAHRLDEPPVGHPAADGAAL
ncbi:hypothetical protein [Microbacterium rhizophilus]|uniref:hypothetical protein n=1 Tax=Microbacterium rhizophilus TaxID=3138934 RepID=UPI0031E892B0